MIDPQLHVEIAKAKGFIFPGPDEDFGMVIVEALAGGTPVIAFNKGGAAEIMIDEVGVLLKDFNQGSLDAAVASFDASLYSVNKCRKRAEEFDESVFRKKISELVARYT